MLFNDLYEEQSLNFWTGIYHRDCTQEFQFFNQQVCWFHYMFKLLIYLENHNIKDVLHLAYGRAIVYFSEAVRDNQHVIFFQQDWIGIYFAA